MKTVELLDGGLTIGARARIVQPGMPPVVWTVTEFRPGSAFTWTARNPGVTTEASHTVEPLGGRSRLVLQLRQTGPLAGVVRLLLGHRTHRYLTSRHRA
jgi:Polyketide cyclase / dehydrase and lipid transport